MSSDHVKPKAGDGAFDSWATHRVFEVTGIVAFTGLIAALGHRIVNVLDPSRFGLLALAALTGYLAADLLTGAVHWFFDTWGVEDAPLVGKNFIRPFREHHDDPMSITRHDFVETNGNNCIGTLPVLLAAFLIPLDTRTGFFAGACLMFLSAAVVATNQFHKWAHEKEPGRLVVALQRLHLILPGEHHRLHHEPPFTTHYCITTGWLNPVLRATDAFRRAEKAISALTGARPRAYQRSLVEASPSRPT